MIQKRKDLLTFPCCHSFKLLKDFCLHMYLLRNCTPWLHKQKIFYLLMCIILNSPLERLICSNGSGTWASCHLQALFKALICGNACHDQKEVQWLMSLGWRDIFLTAWHVICWTNLVARLLVQEQCQFHVRNEVRQIQQAAVYSLN